MSMLRALALLGTGAESYVQGTYDQAAQKRLQSAEDFAQSQRAFKTGQDQRVLDQQAADAQAAAPVTPQPDMAPTPAGAPAQQRMLPDPSSDNIDAGQPGTAAPIPAQAVGGQGGLTPMQATQAAAAANTPEAVQARQIASRVGRDPQAAAAMQSNVQQAQLAKADFANKLWNNDVDTAVSGGFAGLEKFTKSSGATPSSQGAKFVPSADGSTVALNVVTPDGSLRPMPNPDGTPKSYPNNEQGVEQAALDLKRLPVEAKMAHAMAVAKNASDINVQNAMAKYHEAQARWLDVKPDIEQGKIDAKTQGTVARMAPDDKAEYDDLKRKSEKLDEALTKGRMDAASLGQPFNVSNPTIAPLIQQKFDLDQRLETIYGKYREGAPTAKPDPQGLRKTASPTVAASGAAAQAAVGKSESDRLPILQAELAKATTDTDRAAIQHEIDGLPKSARKVGGMTAATAPAPPVATAAAPKPGPMAAATAKPFAVDPTMETKVAAENAEMNGKANRMAYSPEVAAYVAAKKAAQDNADKEKDMAGVEARRKALFASANRGLR